MSSQNRTVRPYAETASDSGTLATRIERVLALEILRGERTPGSQLPSVRALASEYGVTTPTIQRVIDRLEATGLVTARRGSGTRVNDPHASGELSLLPLWFEATRDQPDRAAQILADFLELRRVVAAHLIRHNGRKLAAAAPKIAAAVSALHDADSLEEVIDADLAFTRTVVDAAKQFAVAAMFNTTEQLVRHVPYVAEALYDDRAYHQRVARNVITALGAGDAATVASRVEAVLAAWDRRTVKRFRAHLDAAPDSSQRQLSGRRSRPKLNADG